jgi:hypothetical protein
MTGYQFYLHLREQYPRFGKYLDGNYCFESWQLKLNSMYAFGFRGKTATSKQIPAYWIIEGKDAMNQGTLVDRYWFAYHYRRPSFMIRERLWPYGYLIIIHSKIFHANHETASNFFK